MNQYRSWILSGLASLLLGLSACCPPCEKPDYGSFSLSEEAINKMAFSKLVAQTYLSSTGEMLKLNYFELIQANEAGSYDCTLTNRCGICCATYEYEFWYVQLADANDQRRWEFVLQNDFARNSPEEPADSVFATLRMAYNNDAILGEIVNVEETALEEEVELNGKTFGNVRTFEITTLPFFDDPGVMVRFYFSFTQGIVGFEFADGTVWSLE